MWKKTARKEFSKTIEANLDYLVRFAYYRTRNRAEAEDIVFEAVLRFLEKGASDLKPVSVRLYLFRIVYNLCQDRCRGTHMAAVPLDSVDVPDDADDETLDAAETDRINACLDCLPAREADIIRMSVVDDLSFVEIGEILSIPQSTAKSRYKAGMDKLRKRFFNNKTS